MKKKEAYTEKVDVWAAGKKNYAMVTGNLPFFSENMTEVCRMIVEDDVIKKKHVSQGLNDLLSALKKKSPKLRPALGDVLQKKIIAEALKEHHNICKKKLHPPEIECTISLQKKKADDKKEIFESCFKKKIVSRIKNHIRFQEKSDFYKCLNSSKSVQQKKKAQTLKVNPKMPIQKKTSGRQRFFTLTPPKKKPSQLAAQQSFKPKKKNVNSKATPILNNTQKKSPQLRQVAI
ncbi:hypothetical protein TRFO_20555 [Tritrichomonas foetus]|uniref:non-specific serine/threonine protein kinase n=1 Tax=Tritrichomonas foetus TaxID=1144522 RepID=A0A1J4KFG6_9EUKA|nr:hypothetical protein TRFO_20555 [Tritrichomonas foetus]|eukprot:OHT10183.1 hypothetical protein TRFO_20555 [Tritrichomonas foetus]